MAKKKLFLIITFISKNIGIVILELLYILQHVFHSMCVYLLLKKEHESDQASVSISHLQEEQGPEKHIKYHHGDNATNQVQNVGKMTRQ